LSVILAQTDTTVGFLSQDAQKLYEIKSRETSKEFIKVYKTFKTFLDDFKRVPLSQRAFVRRSKKTTFILKNKAFRVNSIKYNSQQLRELSWYYSTSANESGKKYNRNFCEEKTDIIIEDRFGLVEKSSSSLIKINNIKRRKLR
jgi:tRNA A37 threonylcarbamoyladenosine synthetase subunit TsaC/SUA5/YrdC